MVIDESAWPLLRLAMPALITDDELDGLHGRLREIVERSEVFAVVHDSRGVSAMTASQRRKSAEFMRQVEPAAVRWCAGAALLLSSPLQRGFLTAVLWLYRPSVAMETFAEPVAAERWAKRRLALRLRVQEVHEGSRA
jgi:hypothetical protein